MLFLILYRQSVKFQRKILIPRPIIPYLNLEDENDLYFYVYVNQNALSIAMSINEPVELDNVVYRSQGKIANKSNFLFVQKDLLNLFDLNGKYLLWEVHDEKPELRFKFAKPLEMADDYLNTVLTGVVSNYDVQRHRIAIPKHIFDVKDFPEKNKIFCCLYRHNDGFAILLNNRDDEIVCDEYDLTVIFRAHLEYDDNEVYLVLDISLRDFLKLTHNEEISWSIYYNNGNVFIGFERTFNNVVTQEYSGLVSNIFTQNLKAFTKIPEEVLDALRIKDQESILWKRYKQMDFCRISITDNKPRFIKNRKTGKVLLTADLSKEGIVQVPDVLMDRFALTTDNFIYWRINDENKRYRFAEVEFY